MACTKILVFVYIFLDEVVIGKMKITSGLKWNDDLLNKSSPHFKNETIKIVTEVVFYCIP